MNLALVFKDKCVSANPAMYSEFCRFLVEQKITLDNSMKIAKEYVKTIGFADVTETFKDMTNEEGLPACKEYSESEHKGSDLDE